MSNTINIRKFNSFKSLLFSFFAGIFTFVAFLAVFSVVIMNFLIDKELFFLFVLLSSGISSFVCSITACRLSAQKKLIFSMSSSIILSVAEFLTILCFNNASLSNFVYFLFPIVIFFGFVGCVIGINVRKR